MPDAVNDPVNEAQVEALPKSLARKTGQGIDDITVVKLVYAPFLFEYLGHFSKRRLAEERVADAYPAQGKQHGQTGKHAFLSDLLLGMDRVRIRRFTSEFRSFGRGIKIFQIAIDN